MARQGENIYQRKNGKWEDKYIKDRVNGRIRYGYISGSSYDDVLRKKQRAAKAYEDSVKKESGGGDRLLFSNVASEWMKEKESYLKQSTICRYRNNLNLHLLPAYGDRLVTDITRDDVDAFVTRLCASDGNNGKGLSGNTARSVVSVLKTVVEYARDYRRVPVANLNGIFIKNQGRPIRVFSRNEQKMIEDYLHENMDLDNDLIGIMLCLYTGIRLGELCALRWEDVLLDEGELYIHATMLRIQTPDHPDHRTKVITTMPKSGSSMRRIPLPPNLYKLLSEMKGPDGTYFLTRHENLFIEPRIMESHFKAVIDAVGIADANFHALRHTFATRCIELGFDVKSLSEILGHSSVRLTMDRYVHPTRETKQKNMDKLAQLLPRG